MDPVADHTAAREARRVNREKGNQRRISNFMSTEEQTSEPSQSGTAAVVTTPVNHFLLAFENLEDMERSDREADGYSHYCRAAPQMLEARVQATMLQANDADGERGGRDYLTEGTSTRGLTGVDGTGDAHYFWALRAFVAELEAKFLMKGTKEKEDLLFPAPNKLTWKDLEVIVEVRDKLKNNAESWALIFQQDITDTQGKLYLFVLRGQEAGDSPEMVAPMRRSGAAKKAEAGDRRKDFKKKEPTDFHKNRRQSPHEHEVNNAKMRKEWLRLPVPEVKQQGTAASAEALSEDELEYQSNFNEREEYAPQDHVACLTLLKMQGFPVKTPEEFDKDAQVPRAVPADLLSRKMHLLASNLRSAKQSCSQLAAAMVIQGLIHLSKDIDAFLALEEIEGRGFSEPVDRVPAEINKHQVHDSPETVSSRAGMVSTRCGGQTDDQELPLDEMPDEVVDLVAARWAAAACVNDCGVVDFSEHGHVRVGTIQNQAYEALRLKMKVKDHLTEDQALQMAQNNSWDLLVGTGPLKTSLMIDIKLGRGVVVSYAPSVLGMGTQVILIPLVNLTPPKNPRARCVRKMDPMVCLKTEIFGPELGQDEPAAAAINGLLGGVTACPREQQPGPLGGFQGEAVGRFL
ncbi:hypothetical protein CYMTET_55671 [Cymbomonas tetramitiformis]|uniref:Uncharacterized protein n=1 Tax=Cymbomonas tetramitiformis TaxID=36881 RepID=A0AAE0EMK8_9CHLO|nr:hypothetical protein CYMTET_55671 [Cymbomonas tetramitiformis]